MWHSFKAMSVTFENSYQKLLFLSITKWASKLDWWTCFCVHQVCWFSSKGALHQTFEQVCPCSNCWVAGDFWFSLVEFLDEHRCLNLPAGFWHKIFKITWCSNVLALNRLQLNLIWVAVRPTCWHHNICILKLLVICISLWLQES